MLNKICVIIPARGKSEKLKDCLNSVLAVDYANLEIIVVDDGLEESCLKLLDNFKEKVKILKSNSRGPSYARNLAAKTCDAQFIAFTDSDCIVDKDWLKELAQCFRDYPQASACGGIQKLPDDATNFEKKVFLFMQKAGFISDYIRMTKNPRIKEVNHNPSCNVMYKREIYLKEGGFLEGLWPGEDVEFDYRVKKQGYALFFNQRAIVYHYKPAEWKSFLQMMYRYGLAQGLLVRKHGIFRRTQLVPIFSLFLLSFILLDRVLALYLMAAVFILGWLYFFGIYSLFLKGIFFWHLGFIRGFFNGFKR